ncbi:hypothetical protein [Arthrobacter sp. HS15c]
MLLVLKNEVNASTPPNRRKRDEVAGSFPAKWKASGDLGDLGGVGQG